MKILFAGTPDFAVPTLSRLAQFHGDAASQLDVVGILTNPDAPGKRGKQPVPPSVKKTALELGLDIPIFQPLKLNGEVRAQIANLQPDLLVCVAYGKIFGPRFLGLFPLGGINLHPSLLPKYRGPAPVQAAVLAGEKESGITVQKLGLDMDAGDILLQEIRKIQPRDTAQDLLDRWSVDGAEMVVRVLHGFLANTLNPVEQNHGEASYCSLITKEHGEIDWTESAEKIVNQVRAMVPWPLAWTTWNGQQLFIHKAQVVAQADGELPQTCVPGQVALVDKNRGILIQTGRDLVQIHCLQLQHKKPLLWKDFIHGARDFYLSLLGGLHEIV